MVFFAQFYAERAYYSHGWPVISKCNVRKAGPVSGGLAMPDGMERRGEGKFVSFPLIMVDRVRLKSG